MTSHGSQPRTRSDLVAALPSPPGRSTRFRQQMHRGDLWARAGFLLLAVLLVWATTGAWDRPFPYRFGETPSRAIVARTAFSVPDDAGTEENRRTARAQSLCVYSHDRQQLVELRRALKDTVIGITSAESFATLGPEDRKTWASFLSESDLPNAEARFNELQALLAEEEDLARFEAALEAAFADYERDGLLVSLEHDVSDGSHTAIHVHDVGKDEFTHRVDVTDVRIAEATADLQPRLVEEFRKSGLAESGVETLGQLVFHWLQTKKLPVTLKLNQPATEAARKKAEENAPEATYDYSTGELIAESGRPITTNEWFLLQREHEATLAESTWVQRMGHLVADLALSIGLFSLCVWYASVHERRLLSDLRRLTTVLGIVVATVVLCTFDHNFQWGSEIVPLVMFATTLAIAYHRELAILFSAALTLMVTISLGRGLGEFVVLLVATTSAALLVGRLRSRTKLIYAGFTTGSVVALTAICVGTLMDETYGWSGIGQMPFNELDRLLGEAISLRLLAGALWLGVCCLLAGVLMTGLLPFIERMFGVQTDLSLLELGDAAHPLLQQLVQRAPGTYNHSITVASMGEAAAEAIGANGLLVRVGAYFHDIGKMLKPGYFVENQTNGDNRHETLLPAMSTLVIIAHVKDGADVARQHHLPQSVIDFIEQHHGTTLVEYFYNQAAKQSETDSDSTKVDETSYRYPGPRPQTKEAAVLMLADTAESACRSLVDPAPARIENLVQELVMKRLLDGQFDECGLTFRELHAIEDSLVKSLTAVYHGRVKYPSQQTA
ncbi:MAG: HD family phosphohydrolase [Pirellulaceae bacterium]